ncbi:oxysterol binding protein [Schizosaccharomyces cryophilus OY26]|uniref:Oxysterol binding protein n=1 Tax=Schizosaccharomyces cryophilus (strain OY26 / ATCC MYA-4695 / CBS 11777 / NBRC 106824 / NRRL Y48691) TaxID=653667 RepID=S9VZP0_SCHCR|nr:oxysterol binding protein [Schizosaccharomyces cryophilus OY26]EPY53133.1 oxysterol binding protein [Schizosaccharomyces cryophilus OY26]
MRYPSPISFGFLSANETTYPLHILVMSSKQTSSDDSRDSEGNKKIRGNTKTTWLSFLKSIATFSGDLSSLTAPSFILSSTSLIEYSAYWAEHPELFISLPSGQTPLERQLLVTKWFASTLKNQYATRNERYGSEKKPLNPILGEQFFGRWSTNLDQDTVLTAEQVSHHPPITAYHIYNAAAGVRLEGYNGHKSGFSGHNIHVKQIGHARLTLEPHNEVYYITFPLVTLEGLWYGSPYIELSKKSYIISTSGYMTTIEYSGKGYFTGKKNTFKGSVHQADSKAEPLYRIEGSWTGMLKIANGENIKRGVWENWLDCANYSPINISVPPLEDQGSFESRRVWKNFAVALDSGDYSSASQEKSKIEEAQRQRRREEQVNNETWQRKFFEWQDLDDGFLKATQPLRYPIEEGFWKFKR